MSISSFHHWIKQTFRPARSGRPAKNRPLLTLEPLENRLTPTVTAVGPASDFHIDITEGETVAVGKTDNNKIQVTANGQELADPPQQAASSIEKLTITATNNFANPINLSGINLADFNSLSTVLVKLDAGDTVNRGPGWNAAGSEMIGGQRFLVFTQGNTTLKITDLTPPQPPPSPPPLARGITAQLVRQKVNGKVKLRIRVSFADTGEKIREFSSPLKQHSFKGVKVSTKDSNGDGLADTIVVTGRKNGKKVTRELMG